MIIILHRCTGSDNSIIPFYTFNVSIFVFYLPEDGHKVGRNK